MATKSIQIRLDAKLKNKMEKIFDDMGLDIPTAVRMFFKKVEVEGIIPFTIGQEEQGYYKFTPQEMKEIEEAYKESFDPKNQIGPFDTMEEVIEHLNRP